MTVTGPSKQLDPVLLLTRIRTLVVSCSYTRGFTINWRPNKRRWTVENREVCITHRKKLNQRMSQKRAAAAKTEKRSRNSENSDQLQPCMMSFRRQSRYPGRKLEQSWNYGFEIQHRALVSPADAREVPSERAIGHRFIVLRPCES